MRFLSGINTGPLRMAARQVWLTGISLLSGLTDMQIQGHTPAPTASPCFQSALGSRGALNTSTSRTPDLLYGVFTCGFQQDGHRQKT